MKRGEIYYIIKGYQETGSEQMSGRPAVIVRNDKCNENSDVVEVVYLTTQPKKDLPTHVDVRSAQKNSIALCEQITSVSVSRVGDYIGDCTDYEMAMIEAALCISLDLNFDKPEQKEPERAKTLKDKPQSEKAGAGDLEKQLIQAIAQRDTFQALYEKLLERVMA